MYMKELEKIHFKTTIMVVKSRLTLRNYLITIEREIPGGIQITVSTGSKINVFRNGRITLQGKEDAELMDMFGLLRS